MMRHTSIKYLVLYITKFAY